MTLLRPDSPIVMWNRSPKSQVWTKEEVTAIQHGLVPNVLNLPMYYTIGLADDHTEPGTRLTIGADPAVAATVATSPLVAMPAPVASAAGA